MNIYVFALLCILFGMGLRQTLSYVPAAWRKLRGRPALTSGRVMDPLEVQTTGEWLGSRPKYDYPRPTDYNDDADYRIPPVVMLPTAVLEPPRAPGRHAGDVAGPLDDWTLIDGEGFFAEIVAELKASNERRAIGAHAA